MAMHCNVPFSLPLCPTGGAAECPGELVPEGADLHHHHTGGHPQVLLRRQRHTHRQRIPAHGACIYSTIYSSPLLGFYPCSHSPMFTQFYVPRFSTVSFQFPQHISLYLMVLVDIMFGGFIMFIDTYMSVYLLL